jgi:hypothetical protein
LSGFLNKALHVLPKVLQSGITESASITDMANTFRRGDPIERWLDAETVARPDGYVLKKALWQLFVEDTNSGMNQITFGKELHRLRPEVNDGQRRVNGKLEEVYVGLELRSSRVSGD